MSIIIGLQMIIGEKEDKISCKHLNLHENHVLIR